MNMRKMGLLLAVTMALVLHGGARAERVAVRSTVLDAVAFDAGKGELTLWFDHGGVYVYREVPAGVAERLVRSESKGKFYRAHICGRFDSECLRVADKGRTPAPGLVTAAVRTR